MSRTRKMWLVIGGLAIVALLATGLWWAASPTGVSLAQAPSPTAPAAPYPAPAQGDQGTTSGTTVKDRWAVYQEAFLNAFAARLGTTVDEVNEAYRGAFDDTVDQAVKDGVITLDQGTQMKDATAKRLEQGLPLIPFGGRGFRGPGFGEPGAFAPKDFEGRPGGFERGGPGRLHGALRLEAFAIAFDMTEAELMTELQGGKTLADLAKEKNVDMATVKTSVLEELKASLDQAVQDGKITQEVADQMYNQASTNFDTMVAQPWRMRAPGNPGEPMKQNWPTQ
jgi:hypothetical protein